jgi:high-affinity iron transporter
VVFTLAIVLSTGGQQNALLGAVIGLAVAMVIAFVIYRLGHRLNMGRFFSIVGGLLLVFAAGLLVDAIQNMQELGWLPVGRQVLWHSSALLRQDSTWGDIAHSFLGYADNPTLLQVLAYVGYVAVALALLFNLRDKLGRRAAAPVH